MIPKDLPIRSSLKWLSLIILVMMVPWLIAYVTDGTFAMALMALYWLTPIGVILMAFSLALIIGIIYGCLSTVLSDPYSHLKAFAYAHGLFTSTTSLSLLYTFMFMKQFELVPKFLRFSIPLWIALPIYFSLYTMYTLLAYRSLSEIIGYHSRKPSKDVVKYWRLGAIFCLLTAIIIIIVIIRNLLSPEKPFINHAIPPVYVIIILTTITTFLIILSLDELFFGGKLRRIRYPILAPLIVHTAWVFMPVHGHGTTYSSPWSWPFIVFTPAMFPLPGLITIAGADHVLTFAVASAYFHHKFKVDVEYPPSLILISLGFWLFFEFIAFYELLTSTSIRRGVREGVEFALSIMIGLFSLLFLSKTGFIRVKFRAFRDGRLIIDIVNDGFKDITDFKAYLVGVDWILLDKPLRLNLRLKGGGEVIKVPPDGRITLVSDDWSCNGQVHADEELAIKVIYNIGEKPVEEVYTTSII